ncbi:MAG: cellulase family glycosylhydrolase [bacterium]
MSMMKVAEKVKDRYCFSLVLLAVCVCLFAHTGESFPDQGLATDGRMFVDADDREVILRGANAGMRSKMPPFYPFDPEPDFQTALEDYVDVYDKLGFNVVRLLIMYEAAEPERGDYDEEYLRHYEMMVEEFASRGIRVIVDSHQDLFHRRFCGSGFPDWAIARRYRILPHCSNNPVWELNNLTFAVSSSWDRFWFNKDGIQDQYVKFFRMLAERFKDQPAVIGFEPINEPMTGYVGLLLYEWWNREKLFGLYESVAREVHDVDDRYIIFADTCPLENLGTWAEDRPRPDIDKLAMAPHYYDLGYYKMELSTGRDREMMKNGLKRHLGLARAWNVPVLVGEYGIEMERDDAEKYLKDLYSVFDELFLSGTIWEASASEKLWNGRVKNIIYADGSIRESAFVLDRPYPRAVAGDMEEFSFDPESGRFEIKFKEDGNISRPTVIYLPERVYPDEPEIKLDPGGSYNLDRKQKVLKVEPLGSSGIRKIAITP